LVSTIDSQNSKVLVRSEQDEAAKGKNVVIGEKHTITADEKILSGEVVVEKTTNGKEIPEDHHQCSHTWGVGPIQDCRGDSDVA
jgi:hypothetical protein